MSWTNSIITQAKSTTGGNIDAVTLVNLQTGSFTGDQFSASYGQPSVYDYGAGSSGLTISGNTVTQP